MTLPNRRSIRLNNYDYSLTGLYFVTICAHQKRCIFGSVSNGEIRLSRLGQTVRECWVQIPYHFARVELDAFVIMPNHIHGVLVLHKDWRAGSPALRAQRAAPLQSSRPVSGPGKQVAPRSLAAVIRSFKAGVTQSARARALLYPGPLWQRNYYEHILRRGDDLSDIRQYIAQNPRKWDLDRENPAAVTL